VKFKVIIGLLFSFFTECCKLLCSLLQRNPAKRLDLDVVCLHKWFKYFEYRFYEERSEDLLQKDLPPAVQDFLKLFINKQ